MSFVNRKQAKSVIEAKSKLEVMGLGLETRLRKANYPELVRPPKSVYYQTDNITTTERSFGMPSGSSDDIFVRLSGTTGSALQISSSSTDDISGGIGAITIYIEGLYIENNEWYERSTYSTPTTLNGRNAVQIGTDTDWYRINKIWVLTTGNLNVNDGDLYISPLGQELSLGVPNNNTLAAVIAGYSNSSGGFFSVASEQRFDYTKGNFWVATNKEIRIKEVFYQDFNGSANSDDMTQYQVGEYVGASVSYDYTGAAAYTEKTDIGLLIFTTTGTANAATYYVEYALSNTKLTNN